MKRLFLLPIGLLSLAALAPDQPQSRANEPHWQTRFEQKQMQLKRNPPELIFLGDSITQELERRSATPWNNINAVWQKFYAFRQAVDLGFAGDTTANLLWRIENGELDGIHPRVAVILIGTNNLAPSRGWTAAQTSAAITEIVSQLKNHFPDIKILLLGIPPSGYSAFQAKRKAINAMLSHAFPAASGTMFLSIDRALETNGAVDPALYVETSVSSAKKPLHPNAEGWERIAAAIEPVLSKMLVPQ